MSVTDTQASPPYGNGFKPGNPDMDFHGEKRTNDTHRSRTDPDAKLYRKGKESKLSQMGHALNENRHGLIVGIVAKRLENGSPPKETPRSSTRC